MIRILLSAAVLVGASSAFAGELDNERAVTNHQGAAVSAPAAKGQSSKLNGTIIVRVNKNTHKAEYFKTNVVPKSKAEAENLAKLGQFQAVPAKAVRKELDQDGGTSSWYFYPNYGGYRGYGYGGGYGGYGYGGYGYNGFGYGYGGYGYNNFGYSNLYYYGASYSPCYNYNYGLYNYSYYSPYQFGF